MIATNGYAVQNATSPLAPFNFERRDPGARGARDPWADAPARSRRRPGW